MFTDVFRRRFKYMALNDIFSIFYLPILWFSLNQLNDLSLGTAYMNVNAIFAILLLIIALCVPLL